MGSRYRALVLVGLLVFAVAAVGPAAVAGELDENESAIDDVENETVAEIDGSGPYGLDELREPGAQIAGADPSTRWIDDGSVYVDYPSSDPLSPQAEEWEVENILDPDSTVESDELTIHAARERGADDAEHTLVLVSYERETVTVDGRAVELATDQDVREHSVTFSGAFDRETVSLPNTDGDVRHVAMWLEDSDGEPVDGARWTFEHESTPTSVDAGISTKGDLYTWVGVFVFLPALVGIGGSVYGARRVLRKTGTGPQIPGFIYSIGVFVALMAVLLFGWREFALLITGVPVLLGVALALVAAVAYLEYGGGETIRALFVRDELRDSVSPNGDDVHDTLYQEFADLQLVRLSDGKYEIVRPGIRPFLARWFGVAPVIDVSDLSTRVKGVGKWDWVYVADPESDAPIEWEPPRLRFPLSREPEPGASGLTAELQRVRWDSFVWGAVGAVLGYVLGSVIGLTGLFTALGAVAALAVKTATVEDGRVEFCAAPVHYTSARPAVLKASCELEDARTIDELEEIALRESTTTALEARALQNRMDKTVTERMTERELGLEDVGESDESGAVDGPGESETDESDETSLVVRDD